MQFTVLTDRSQGGSSIKDGHVELMVRDYCYTIPNSVIPLLHVDPVAKNDIINSAISHHY